MKKKQYIAPSILIYHLSMEHVLVKDSIYIKILEEEGDFYYDEEEDEYFMN